MIGEVCLLNSSAKTLYLTKLDKVLQETASLSSAKAFGCHTGEWGDDLGLEIVDGFKSDNNVPSDYIPED